MIDKLNECGFPDVTLFKDHTEEELDRMSDEKLFSFDLDGSRFIYEGSGEKWWMFNYRDDTTGERYTLTVDKRKSSWSKR